MDLAKYILENRILLFKIIQSLPEQSLLSLQDNINFEKPYLDKVMERFRSIDDVNTFVP